MRDSKPQRSVQQHKSLKVTRNATNRHKHINEALNQILTNNLFKISCKYTQGMLSNWKICFNVFNIRSYEEFLCNLSKINKNVSRTTSTNFPIWCQQTTKTALKCDTESFGPFSHLWSVNHKCMHYSKPQHNSLKVTRNETNRDKHINKASKQKYVNYLFKQSCKYTQGMLSNWKICFNVFSILTYDELLCLLKNIIKLFRERLLLT